MTETRTLLGGGGGGGDGSRRKGRWVEGGYTGDSVAPGGGGVAGVPKRCRPVLVLWASILSMRTRLALYVVISSNRRGDRGRGEEVRCVRHGRVDGGVQPRLRSLHDISSWYDKISYNSIT